MSFLNIGTVKPQAPVVPGSTVGPFPTTTYAPATGAQNAVFNGVTTIGAGTLGTMAGQNLNSAHWTNPIRNSNIMSTIVTFTDRNGQEIVHISSKGDVVWANGYQIDEAAEAFSKSLHIGVEKAIGVNENIKRKMRDSVFEEIIKLVKETGSITADELTRYWECAKIIDKLRGAE